MILVPNDPHTTRKIFELGTGINPNWFYDEHGNLVKEESSLTMWILLAVAAIAIILVLWLVWR